MASFTRLNSAPIDQRGPIERPNLVVVLDATLLKEATGQVFQGVDPITPLLINADPDRLKRISAALPGANLLSVDLSTIVRELVGAAFVSAAAAASAGKCVPSITLPALEDAVRSELADFGLSPDLIEKNVAAAAAAYRRAPAVRLAPCRTIVPTPPGQAVPYLGGSRFVAPVIRHRGSAALRQTGNWRMERPEIDLAKCKRCFLCYLYCPEAAMRLDAENFPRVDYDHCKGCMICYEECPTGAIARRIEA